MSGDGSAKKIACIHGDGIGPEIVGAALEVLDALSRASGREFDTVDVAMGGASIDLYGEPLTRENLILAGQCDAVLMGSIGGDTLTSPWYKLPPHLRPEAGLLALRKGLGLFANLRPAKLYNQLRSACPLKEVGDGIDLLLVRELTGGLYFGERRTTVEAGRRLALDTLPYSEEEIRRVAHVAFRAARGRRKSLVSVDKANVLDSSRLWRQVVEEVSAEYADVRLEHMLVDNCAMQLILHPQQFDVILTENMFGDILSDEASVLTGSIGMLPSASLREDAFGLYEPSHGSAPALAGLDVANPLATILSLAMLLRHSFGWEEGALAVEAAVETALEQGWRTKDLAGLDTRPENILSCSGMGAKVAGLLRI